MSDDAAVHADCLERRFGAVRVLRGLDLVAERSQVLALFGPNGSGKTTFLRIVAGLVTPHSGKISVLGVRLPGDAMLRARIGVVSHESFAYADLSARENLEYYARLYRVKDLSHISDLIDEVGLRGAKDRPARTFSRGMMQRLALARASVHSPELLLLDEPFTGLDPQGCQWLTSMIADRRDKGTSVIVTTHDFEHALSVADSGAILSAGTIAWRGATLPESTAEMAKIYHATVSEAR